MTRLQILQAAPLMINYTCSYAIKNQLYSTFLRSIDASSKRSGIELVQSVRYKDRVYTNVHVCTCLDQSLTVGAIALPCVASSYMHM